MRRGRSWLRWIVVPGVLLAAGAGFWTGPPPAMAAVEPQFCGDDVTRDFEAPFRHMPADRPPPEGELPFGPRNLSMFRLGWENVVLAGHKLGYRFGAKDLRSRDILLNWLVEARLLAVGGRGRVRRVAARHEVRVRQLDDVDVLDFTFPVARRGLYRLDVIFSKLGGRRLGAYREYFRVLKRTVRMRMAIGSTSMRAGEVGYARVENLGSTSLNAPMRYLVERLDGASWAPVTEAITPGTVLDPEGIWWIGGGEAAPCAEFSLSSAAPSGAYRVRASVQPFGTRRHPTLTAPFSVVP